MTHILAATAALSWLLLLAGYELGRPVTAMANEMREFREQSDRDTTKICDDKPRPRRK